MPKKNYTPPAVHEAQCGKDLDNLNFTVVKGAVSGLYTIMECIIMYDKQGRFLLAAIDDDLVKYYTNIAEFERKLPKTIQEWRTPFKEKHVAYMGDLSKN